ncbi:MAG: hypothetical protein ACXIUV_09210 [Alkalilacustris sp.]
MVARGAGARGWGVGVALAALIPGGALAEGAPLSAIDWLSQVTVAPPPLSGPGGPLEGAVPMPGAISVTSLDGPTTDALGLVPAARVGLPRDLWGMTPAAQLAEALSALEPDTLPALQGLILSLLVAELDPPQDAEGRGALFAARLQRLTAFGALDPALALVEAADPATPALFGLWLDLALLAGDAAAPCAALRAEPALSRDLAARIYCAARAGDWEGAEALLTGPEGAILAPQTRRLLARFLDPEAGETPAGLPMVQRPTPLMWQIADALGEGWASTQLPLAFAHADLAPSVAWRAQIEAAERLARAGVLTPNRLLGLYTRRAPAASGGVWDRAAAVQRLDAALAMAAVPGAAPDTVTAAGAALLAAWEVMAEAELEGVLAVLMADRLADLTLEGDAAALAWRAGLLAGRSDPPPPPQPGAAARDGFLAAIAAGSLRPEQPRPPGAMPAAIAEGLTAAPDPDTRAMLEDGRRGELLLGALRLMQGGGRDDPRVVSEALTLLRAAGQEAVARRAALELLLLDRRG